MEVSTAHRASADAEQKLPVTGIGLGNFGAPQRLAGSLKKHRAHVMNVFLSALVLKEKLDYRFRGNDAGVSSRVLFVVTREKGFETSRNYEIAVNCASDLGFWSRRKRVLGLLV
jgi:hypothetical protein